jgi:anti-anti-sigma factor
MTPHDSHQGLTLSVRSQDGYTIATIGGDLDIARVPALREQLFGLLGPDANQLVVVLSDVTFCDSSGLAVLIGARRRAWVLGGVLRLVAPAPSVAAALRLTGLDLQFEIFPTELAATSAAVPYGVESDHERLLRNQGGYDPRLRRCGRR